MSEGTIIRLKRQLSVIMLLIMLLSACGPLTLTPLPTAVEPTATAPAAATTVPASAPTVASIVPKPTNTPEPRPSEVPPSSTPEPIPTVNPTPTPNVTATPVDLANLPMPAPRLLYWSPAWGQEQLLDAPVELVFDQPMDQASVESAFAMSPTVKGAFDWSNEHSVSFTAEEELERGQRYQVMLAITARNTEGAPLEEPVSFSFDTVGFLEVTEVQPAPGTNELDPDTAVTVIFNRPVVPLTSIDQLSGLPDPLTFTPTVRGEGEWLNTSIYLFRPTEGFLPATQYTARIAAGLSDTIGGVLPGDFTWSFSTFRPAVYQIYPDSGFKYVAPTDTVRIVFNQPMDHASVEASFTLLSVKQSVSGTFSWSGGETPISPETMTFHLNNPLPRNTICNATVEKGALARTGTMGLAASKSWSFTTVKVPAVVSTSPKNGAKGVKTGERLEIIFASPMQDKTFLDHLTITPEPPEVHAYWSKHDTKVQLSFHKDPVTTYTATLDADTPGKYGLTLGTTTTVRFTTGNLSAFAYLRTSGSVGSFSAYTDTLVYAECRNVSKLNLALYTMSPYNFTMLNGFGNWDWRRNFQPSESDLIRRWSREVQSPPNESRLLRIDLTHTDGTSLPPGLYYLKLTAPGVTTASTFSFVRSRLNLTVQQSRHETLVWVTDLASGEPVGDVPIALRKDKSSNAAEGATSADGVFRHDAVGSTGTFFAIAGTPGEDDFGIASSSWDSGIQPYNFNLPYEYSYSSYSGHVYTERPIYRPGQSVYFKGILRHDDDAHYTVPTGIETVEVVIHDPQWKTVYKESLPLNDMGTFHGELVLDEEAALGYYYIEFGSSKKTYASTSFRVAEYRKPEYQVTVIPDRDDYVAGDTINVTVEASYYFGGPVADAQVHWSLLSRDFYFSYHCPPQQRCPWYSWSDSEWRSWWYEEEEESYGSYGQLIAEGDAKTDEQGRVTFQVPADLADKIQSQRFTIEASVTDINGQQVSNRTAVTVHRGAFYIGAAPRGYLARVDQEKEIALITVDRESEAVPGIPLTVIVMERHWYSVKKQDDDGYYYWDWTVEDTPVQTSMVTTDADGEATVTFTPLAGGSYRVRAIGHDAQGNEIRSGAYFWAWGGRTTVRWRRQSDNRIELIPDKQEYEVGDVAEILIPSPYTGTVHALVSVGRGHLLDTQVMELQGNSEVLRIAITEDHVPNIYVSVVLVQGSAQAPDGLASFKMGQINLLVSTEVKELKITLAPDRPMDQGQHYGPRQTATYDVLVTDHAGNPVEAELSLRLADLAVLALADELGPTLMQRYWSRRRLGVRTFMPLTVAMEPLNRELRPGAKGGGGGEGEAMVEGFVRTNFADTAFWQADIRTGSDGRAQVQVELPDNLTTWRMQARGISADTLVGRAEVDILATLDLLLRPVLPRFFVVGDQAKIGTIVHNNTNDPQEVRIDLAVEGLSLEGDSSVTVTIAPGGKTKVSWPVTALSGSEAMVRMTAQSGSLFDGREDTLPVYRYSTPEVVGTAGRLAEAGVRQELVQLPSVLDPTQGELTVQIDAALTGATRDALRYLEHYPYECTEQTVSRFLPNVLTLQVLKEMGLERPDLEENLRRQVSIALQRLYAYQHYDGGWGWWGSDESNPYLTAYVIQGLIEAHRAGFTVDRNVIDKGVKFLRSHLPGVSGLKYSWSANRLAYLFYVLAEYHVTFEKYGTSPELARAIALFEKRHLLSRYGQATLAVALHLLEPEESSRVNTLLGDLSGDAIYSATGTHWEEAYVDYWNMNTDIRTTAKVIWALSRIKPESDLLPNAVRWLMAMRKEGYWKTTQNTAWSLISLVAYMRASGEMQGDYSYSVYLNGEVLDSGDVNQENLEESHVLQVEIAQLLVEESNRLIFQRHPAQEGQTGKGQLYYSVHLRYFLPVEEVKALNRGIIVAREYTLVDGGDEPVSSAQVGDLIRVKLTLVAPNNLHYVVVEDPLPAGCEGVDLSLKTTSVVGERPQLRNLTAEEESRWYRWWGWGWWWFSHTEMRDEKVALFATYLPRGTYQYTYLMRASVPGEFRVMPSLAYQMYFPEVFGRSDGGNFVVVEE